MLETEQQIQYSLIVAGEPITFNKGVIRGIPGQLVYNVPSFDSPYDIDKQDFTFQVSKKDFSSIGGVPEDLFTYNLLGENYSFKVLSYTNDLTGWLTLTCSFQGIVT